MRVTDRQVRTLTSETHTEDFCNLLVKYDADGKWRIKAQEKYHSGTLKLFCVVVPLFEGLCLTEPDGQIYYDGHLRDKQRAV